MVSQKKAEPSEAEKGFVNDLREAQKKVENYTKAIEKVRIKKKYQEIHVSYQLFLYALMTSLGF